MIAVLPELRVERCVRYRYRYSECRRCADACPHEAIELTDEGIRLEASRCQNCGLCTSACRSAALVAGNVDRVELLKRAIRAERFTFACEPSGLDADARVPCLGALDAAMLAYLARRGVDTELRGAGHCTQCPHGRSGAAQLALNLEGSVQLEKGAAPPPWRQPRLAAEAVAKRGGEFSAGRRQLFRRLAAHAADRPARADDAAGEPLVLDKAIRPGKWFVPPMRELLEIVCKRDDGAAFACRAHAALPLMDLQLAAGCTACEACFRACPTGALQVRESDEQWALSFQLDGCVGCGVCLEVCQPRVLHAREEFDAAPGRQATILLALTKQRCARCDRFFVSPEPRGTCAVCAQDEDCFAELFG